MKKIVLSFVVLTFFVFSHGFASAEVTSTSTGVGTSTLNFQYSPTSYSRDAFNIPLPYVANQLIGAQGGGLYKDWQVFNSAAWNATYNEIDWVNTELPSRSLRQAWSDFWGNTDSRAHIYLSYGENNDPVEWVSEEPEGEMVMGDKVVKSKDFESQMNPLFLAYAELKKGTGARKMMIKFRFSGKGQSESTSAAIVGEIAKAMGKSSMPDAIVGGTGANIMTGNASAWQDIISDAWLIAYTDNKPKAETKKTQTSQPIVPFIAPVFFNFDKADILESEWVKIDKIAEAIYRYLQQDQDIIFSIVGNCDIRGEENYNYSPLGANRAINVYKTLALKLAEKGVDRKVISERIIFSSAGKNQPYFIGKDPISHALNRRADIYMCKGITDKKFLAEMVVNGVLPLPNLEPTK